MMSKAFLSGGVQHLCLFVSVLCLAGLPAKAAGVEFLVQDLKVMGAGSEADYLCANVDGNVMAASPVQAGDPDAVSGRFENAIIFSSADGRNTMQWSGRLQGDYRTYTNQAEPSTFEMRRVLLGVGGRFWRDIRYNITTHLYNVEANGGQGVLDEAWMEPFGQQAATLRIGQFYTPFSLEDANSSKYLDFIERASIVNQSQSANDSSDIGVMLHGTPMHGVFYRLAHTNGASTSAVNKQVAGGRETLLRGGVDFASLFGWTDAVYHLGLDYAWGRKPAPAGLGAGSEFGKLRSESRSGIFRPMKLTGIDNNYLRTRKDMELALAYGPFKFQGDVIAENYAGVTQGGMGYSKTVRGHYANLMWMMTGEKYAGSYGNGAFGSMRPNRNFTVGGGGWGAWEIGLRYSRLDAGNLNADAPVGVLRNEVGYASGMHALTLGLKWIMNPNTRVLFNYSHSSYDHATAGDTSGAAVSSDNAYMMRAQFDF